MFVFQSVIKRFSCKTRSTPIFFLKGFYYFLIAPLWGFSWEYFTGVYQALLLYKRPFTANCALKTFIYTVNSDLRSKDILYAAIFYLRADTFFSHFSGYWTWKVTGFLKIPEFPLKSMKSLLCPEVLCVIPYFMATVVRYIVWKLVSFCPFLFSFSSCYSTGILLHVKNFSENVAEVSSSKSIMYQMEKKCKFFG